MLSESEEPFRGHQHPGGCYHSNFTKQEKADSSWQLPLSHASRRLKVWLGPSTSSFIDILSFISKYQWTYNPKCLGTCSVRPLRAGIRNNELSRHELWRHRWLTGGRRGGISNGCRFQIGMVAPFCRCLVVMVAQQCVHVMTHNWSSKNTAGGQCNHNILLLKITAHTPLLKDRHSQLGFSPGMNVNVFSGKKRQYPTSPTYQ